MKVIIIEDELLAQAKLEAMLNSLDKSIEVLAKINSVDQALRWISSHPSPDLAFVDIQLSDDHSFEIFRRHPVNFPVIFTTAYDKYILESFEFNSVDYLLKPITEEKLKRSLDKLKKLEHHFIQGNILKLIEHSAAPSKTRIVAKKGNEFVALDLDDVAYFYTEHKLVFVKDFSGRQLIVDKNLGDLEATLDKNKFFRLNRKLIAQLKAIERFKPDKGKIRIYLKPEMKEEIHVSKETAPEFRTWVGMKGNEE
jgi:DNA-binding LytR/AlgR family response regulator